VRLLELGVIYLLAGRYDTAIESLPRIQLQGVRSDPRFHEVLRRRGLQQ
jgi:hypothetical protein